MFFLYFLLVVPVLAWLGDHQCPDHRQTCPDDSTCCPASGGDFCCKNTSVPDSTCCRDGCCTDAEECCKDDKGYACCIQQTTYCVPKDSSQSYPARCCPRWTVGCGVGSVGCCDPAQPWQWRIDLSTSRSSTLSSLSSLSPPLPSSPSSPPISPLSSASSSAPASVYALFTTGVEGLVSMQIDATTGKISNKVKVTGLDDNPVGETTREFLFDSQRKLFYYLDANFTKNGGVRPEQGREMYLYTVDALTGKGSKQIVQGAVDYPTGQVMCGAQIIIATQSFSSSLLSSHSSQRSIFAAPTPAFTGFDFYSLDPVSAKATFIGHINRGADEDSDAFYCGFHRDCSPDSNTVFRFGYKDVSSQSEQGLSITTFSSSSSSATAAGNITTKWVDELTPQHDYYMTMDRYDVNRSNFLFVSLAPYKNDPTRGLDVVQWSLNPQDFEVIAHLGNAHPPSVMGLGVLGYLGSDINGETYAAMVVVDGTLPAQDQWALAVVNLPTKNATVLPLEPRTIAGTWGVSGLGVA